MRANLTIGDFSRMTHLSVKTLRHYHHVGLLAPADVDQDTGYRFYTTDQVPTAQIIRRFRELDMPVDQLRSVLAAPGPAARNELIAAHLARLEGQLRQTRDAVESLRALLTGSDPGIPVEYRAMAATPAIAVHATVTSDELGGWWADTFAGLHTTLRTQGIRATGPVSGQFATELFTDERGAATLFVPVAEDDSATVVPAVELAIAVHQGSHADVDRTYGVLGSHVAEHALGVAGPIRETYLVSRLDTPDQHRWRTEIGWPIFRTAAG
jgi:DNA-binding transcriptional MerR regulator/effector-binding domain-containing protein